MAILHCCHGTASVNIALGPWRSSEWHPSHLQIHLCYLMGRLQEAIQSAADQASNAANSSSSSTASDRDRGPSAKHLKPIVTAVEMVFGSAAALSATFGFKVLHIHVLLITLLSSDVAAACPLSAPVHCRLTPCLSQCQMQPLPSTASSLMLDVDKSSTRCMHEHQMEMPCWLHEAAL